MTLVKWTPKPMNISNEFDNMFRTLLHSDSKNPSKTRIDWKPEIDIIESDKFFLIKADIAELNKKDIKISVKGEQLTISGERKEVNDNEDDYFHYRERSAGKFSRSFNLPESINKDKIHAQFKNGTLSIELEKHDVIVPQEKNIVVN
mgnify:FL=1